MEVTGYDPNETFFATRYKQGGRTVYSIDLSLTQISALIPAPSSERANEGNRQVKESHARAFGDYVRTEQNWVAPALVLRAPDIFEFEVRETVGGTEFGVLAFPKHAKDDLKILDGQHRILGIHLAIQSIGAELEKTRSTLAASKRNEESPAVIEDIQRRIEALLKQRERFSLERTTLQIFVEDDSVAYKQMFFDIADNALGISSSVKARFDSRKVVNRSLEEVMNHALLKGRVDLEQDRIGRTNPNLIGAKQVGEIVRTLAVGLEGRIGRRLEDELSEAELVEKTNDFLDVLLNAFPPLAAVADGELSPEELRRSSMLGSLVVLRVLAGVHADLKSARHKLDDEEIAEFFNSLAPHFEGPASEDSIWVQHVPNDVFIPGSYGPRSRRQDLKQLRDSLVDWAVREPSWLKSPGEVQA
ncbi:DNA sulfur modification protein DndB [Frigoribacterium sp. 9N]|uniref:DNA sulfur modification protein DndB n=1 Tax=Frigoribacterium sp. 9N TaxID=2653144 RepID=UPI0012F21FC2|nr:DNA sulfur modification protein DndB [Frigoribacterium sp. 9N]VXB79362.1 conserved hypothetical protein [Frigoribacterium sp. 9N]